MQTSNRKPLPRSCTARVAPSALRPLSRALAAVSLLTLALLPAHAQTQILAQAQAQVLPTGAQVVAGQAQISILGNRMTVTSTPQTILNWNSFSIGTNSAVHFQQAGASSAVLNRVTGNDPSSILGSLSSNGRVWLLNPNGVLFGASARVDVAGLVASTLRLNDGDWLAGRYSFSAGRDSAALVNQGELRSSFGGSIALLGSSVSNEGLIQAPGGGIVLAAGSSIELVDTGAPNLGVRITAPAGEARNLGTLQAAGGRIDIHAAAVNSSGVISADGFASGPGGEVWIKAGGAIELGAASRTAADGSSGGSVHIESGGARTTLQGAVSAQGAQGAGGTVVLLGREVGLLDGASVDVSGALGGGSVIVGGGLRGQDTRYPNAQAVYFGPQARISADATQSGNGGNVVLWSDRSTRAFGALSVRGGAQGGDGGFIETSGGWLDARPARVDTAAPRGRSGNWLLDPFDLIITDGSSTFGGTLPNFNAGSNNASVSAGDIVAALNAGTSVTVTTGGAAGNESGNIFVSAQGLVSSVAAPGELTIIADGNLNINNSTLGSSSGLMGITLVAGRSGSGSVSINSSSIFTGGGGSEPTVTGAAVSTAGPVSLLAAGSLSITGTAVAINANTSLSAAGAITVQAGSITVASGATLQASATGDAIVLSGSGTAPLSSFSFGGGAGALATPNGRSIVYAASSSPQVFNPGALAYDFKRHGAAYGAWSGDSGNGFVFAAQQTAQFQASISDRAYDGGLNAPLAGATVLSAAPGDSGVLAANAAAVYGSPNAGTGKSASFATAEPFSFIDSNERPVYGYTLIGSLSGNVTPRFISGTASAVSRVYDGGTAATVNVGGLQGLVAGENLSVLASASFSDRNVGSNKPVSASYQLADGPGGLAANYSFLSPEGGLSASITPRPVSASGLVVSNKVYDGNTTAQFTGVVSVAGLPGDVLLVSGQPVASFADKNVGTAKPISISGLALAGADAANYTLAQPQGLSASITPLALALLGLSADNKVYDGNTGATLSGTASASALAGDAVTLGGTPLASFADKNVGSGKAVSVSGYTLAGADAANYTLAQPQGLHADITPLGLTVSGLGAVNKVYDGGTGATLTGSASVLALAGDVVTLGGTPLASFADKNVGNGKAVSVSGYTLAGADAANYALLLQPLGLSANITPLTVAVGGVSALNRSYDGGLNAALAGTATVATLPGDSVTLGGSPAARFADRNVGSAKPVTVAGYALAGADAANYSLVQPQGLRATINPAVLQYVAATTVGTVGPLPANLSGTVTGFVGGDTLATATQGSLLFTTTAPAGSPPGAYGISGGGLSALNYVFTQAASNAQALTVIDLTPQTSAIIGASNGDNKPGGKGFTANGFAFSDSRSLAEAGVNDETVLDAVADVQPVADFGAVRLSKLSTREKAALLSGRRLFMDQLLADSLRRLERDPALADLRECETLEEARLGTCVVTAKFKARLAAQGVNVAALPLPLPTAVPDPAPAPVPSAVPAPAPTAVPAPMPAAVPTAVPTSVPTLGLSASKRAVRSAALPQIERKIALVVGVDNYQDAAIPKLANAVNDARAVASLFEQRLGYETVVVGNATRPALVAALNQLALTLNPRDSVVVYYAGHGELVQSTQLGYWLLADSAASKPETWLSNADISRLVAQMGASQVALVSDSCYSGSLATEERIRAMTGTLDPQAVLGRKSVVVMSSGGNEPVADEGRDGHSPFAWNLMNQLGQLNNWQPGGNVFERVRFAVARSLPQRPQYSASKAAGHQTGGDYLFEQRQLESGR